jgi:hypothetical protein
MNVTTLPLIAAILLAMAPGGATAGERPAAAADPDAPVPATRYLPALPYGPALSTPTSPADNWKALNRAVAGHDSMAPAGGEQPPAAGAVPPPASQRAAADPHAHHHGAGQ